MASTIKVTNINTPDGSGSITFDRPVITPAFTSTGIDDNATAEALQIEDAQVTCQTGDLVFATAGKGICLGATSNTDANTLEDYEEGTWTPSIADDSLSASESQAYNTQNGQYTKIGNIVIATGSIDSSSIGTLTASERTRIIGWPFTSSDTSTTITIANPGGMAKTADAALQGFMNSGDSYGFIVESSGTAGYNHVTLTMFDLGNFSFTAVYHTSS